MSASRNYCFTLNNYTPDDIKHLNALSTQYIIYGKETCPTTGTPHLQGFVRFANDKSFSAARKSLVKCHVELAKCVDASIKYCSKDGDYTEYGTRPKSRKAIGADEEKRWRDIRMAAEEGRLDDIPERIRFINHNLIKTHREDAMRRRILTDTVTENLWYYGDTGTGKSRSARAEFTEFYSKNCNKWWCGYTDEKIVLLEDIDKRHEILGYFLKIWGDRYPFLAEVKGGSVMIRPERIIVTSNYHPSEIFTDTQTLNPILRRFKLVHFKSLKKTDNRSVVI